MSDDEKRERESVQDGGRECMRWQEREREVGDCFTNRIPLINHPVWTAGLLKTGRNGIPTWKCGLQTLIRQKNISCQTLQPRGAGEGPCFLVVREPQTGGSWLTWLPRGPRLHKATQGPAISGQGATPQGQQSSLRAKPNAAVREGGSDLGSGSDMGLETRRPPC